MKKIILLLALLAAGSAATFAQCGKKITLVSSKTSYLDANNKVEKTEDEKAKIELSTAGLTITHGEEEEQMTGTIKITACNWKTPFKEGKTVIKTTLTDRGGDEKHGTITIEGKEGKVTMTLEIDEMPGKKIQIAADKFEEKA